MEELKQVKQQIKIFIEECNDKKSLELLDLLAQGKMLRSKLIMKIAGVNKESIKQMKIELRIEKQKEEDHDIDLF